MPRSDVAQGREESLTATGMNSFCTSRPKSVVYAMFFSCHGSVCRSNTSAVPVHHQWKLKACVELITRTFHQVLSPPKNSEKE